MPDAIEKTLENPSRYRRPRGGPFRGAPSRSAGRGGGLEGAAGGRRAAAEDAALGDARELVGRPRDLLLNNFKSKDSFFSSFLLK